MRTDLVFGVGVLVRKGVDTRERVSNIAKAVHQFFLDQDLYVFPDEMMKKEINDDFSIYRADFNDRGQALMKKGWFNYLARFERNRYADPFDTRVLMKYLKKHSEQPST